MVDAVVLAGGKARRLGGADKPGLEVGGLPLLERVVAAVADADIVVVVGPQRALALPRPVLWCEEQPPAGDRWRRWPRGCASPAPRSWWCSPPTCPGSPRPCPTSSPPWAAGAGRAHGPSGRRNQLAAAWRARRSPRAGRPATRRARRSAAVRPGVGRGGPTPPGRRGLRHLGRCGRRPQSATRAGAAVMTNPPDAPS